MKGGIDSLKTKEILEILPLSIKSIVNNIQDKETLQEIRLKVNKPLILSVNGVESVTSYIVTLEDIKGIVQKISNYSVYAFEEEIRQGYITIKGGHRVGICGRCIVDNERIKTIRDISSINIRVAHEIIGCSNKLMEYILDDEKNIVNTILISPPKCGKTTYIRDIARNISGISKISGKKVCIIDERSEIAACSNGIPQLDVGLRTDVLDCCPKSEGIMMGIRSMSPDVIVCDEIGTYKDIESIIIALNSGVNVITTIHGYDIEDLFKRPVFDEILKNKVFERAIILSNRNGIGTIEYIYDLKKNLKMRRVE